jgi:polar amino acid transport system permease protein
MMRAMSVPATSRVSRTRVAASAVVALAVVGILRAVDWEYIRALDFRVVWEYRTTLLRGYGVTLAFTAAGTGTGMLLGTALAVSSQTRVRPLRWLVAAYVEFWRNTPLLVQLIWIHFALPVLTGVNLRVTQSGFIGMALNTAAYYTEIVRAGIEAVARGQWEAAHALGLPAWSRWRHVILPQALRLIVPPTANLVIGVFKATAILAILGIGELMRETIRVSEFTYKPVEMYTATALIYVISGWLLSRASGRLEFWLRRSDR